MAETYFRKGCETLNAENKRLLTGTIFSFTQIIWWGLFLLTIGTIGMSVWVDSSFRSALGWEAETYQIAVKELGWSANLVDAVHIISANLIRISYIGMGLLIYWRKSANRLRFLSLFF